MPINYKDNYGGVSNVGKMYYKDNGGGVSEIKKAYYKDNYGGVSEVFSGGIESSPIYAIVNGITLLKLDNEFNILQQVNLMMGASCLCLDNQENIYIATQFDNSYNIIYKYDSNFNLITSTKYSCGIRLGNNYLRGYPIAIQYSAVNDYVYCLNRADYRTDEEGNPATKYAYSRMNSLLTLSTLKQLDTGNMRTMGIASSIFGSDDNNTRDGVGSVDLELTKKTAYLGNDHQLLDTTPDGYLSIYFTNPYQMSGGGVYYVPLGRISWINDNKSGGCHADCKMLRSNNRDCIININDTVNNRQGFGITDRYTLATPHLAPTNPFDGYFMRGKVDIFDNINIISMNGTTINKYNRDFTVVASATFGSVQAITCA